MSKSCDPMGPSAGPLLQKSLWPVRRPNLFNPIAAAQKRNQSLNGLSLDCMPDLGKLKRPTASACS